MIHITFNRDDSLEEARPEGGSLEEARPEGDNKRPAAVEVGRVVEGNQAAADDDGEDIAEPQQAGRADRTRFGGDIEELQQEAHKPAGERCHTVEGKDSVVDMPGARRTVAEQDTEVEALGGQRGTAAQGTVGVGERNWYKRAECGDTRDSREQEPQRGSQHLDIQRQEQGWRQGCCQSYRRAQRRSPERNSKSKAHFPSAWNPY